MPTIPSKPISRREWIVRSTAATLALGSLGTSGCMFGGPSPLPDLVWGRRGNSPGRFTKPRAVTIDAADNLYVVDTTPRIQVFTGDGEMLRNWQTPEFANGKPSGLSMDREGNLLVSDTHYFRVLTYTPTGELLKDRTIGGVCGHGEGEFGFVTDCVQDSQGNYFVAEYGEFDRIQKFSPERKFLLQWGSPGGELMQFKRPQKLVIDDQDQLWVTDACNHRVQVFDIRGNQVKLVAHWGQHGYEPGQLNYPYDILLDGQGHVYLCEFGNHRVQKFTLDGKFLASWGTNGREPGQLDQPWGIIQDSRGRMYVLDSYNHRVQRFWL